MTADDVRTVCAFGKRIARCVLKMGDLITEVARALPIGVGVTFIARAHQINMEMGEAAHAFVREAVVTEMDA